VQRVLITGVSGVGKSTVIEELRARGFRAVDTDYGGYCSPGPDVEPPRPTAELEQALRDQAEVEPLLRAGATIEIDTDAPLDAVIERLLEHTFAEVSRP